MRQMFMPGGDGGQQQMYQQKTRQSTSQQQTLSARQSQQQKQGDDRQTQMLLKRALKKKRSVNYMTQVQLLDTGGGQLNEAAAQELINEIRENLGPLDPSLGIPVGIIAKCYLGEPYEVHTLDLKSNIIQHFVRGEAMPGLLENYRGMAINGSYEFIEVYSTYVCAVRENGSVTIIEA